jgi:hypothetical protein
MGVVMLPVKMFPCRKGDDTGLSLLREWNKDVIWLMVSMERIDKKCTTIAGNLTNPCDTIERTKRKPL